MPDEPGPRQRAAETKRRRSRERIINAVLDLYDEEQAGDHTLERIAEEAGVGAATIAVHYPRKYDLLKAAHERILAPIIEPIRAGTESGIYKPDDGVKELLRYVYSVAKLCQRHRALTVAMIRTYFDVSPEDRKELYSDFHNWGEKASVVLGGHIALGMWPVTKLQPFPMLSVWSPHDASHVTSTTLLSHGLRLLMDLYHSPSANAPEEITHELSASLVPLLLPGYDRKIIDARFQAVQRSVDTWIENLRIT